MLIRVYVILVILMVFQKVETKKTLKYSGLSQVAKVTKSLATRGEVGAINTYVQGAATTFENLQRSVKWIGKVAAWVEDKQVENAAGSRKQTQKADEAQLFTDIYECKPTEQDDHCFSKCGKSAGYNLGLVLHVSAQGK